MSLSDADKKARRAGIGGTDVADIVEGNLIRPYRSKVEGLEIEDNAAMRRGRVLEAPTLELYAIETGANMLPGGLVRHPKKDIFLGNLDARAIRDGDERVVEAKTANRHALGEWGDGGDEIPRRYLVQVQWYLGVTGLPLADVAALLGGDIAVYTIHADPELFGLLAERAERFWVDHVLAKRPPPPDASAGYSDWLSRRFNSPSNGLLAATPEIDATVAEYRRAAAQAEVAVSARDTAKNALKAAIGEARGIQGDGYRVLWSLAKGREKTDWAAVCREAGIGSELVAKHTTRGSAYRVFKPSWKEGGDE